MPPRIIAVLLLVVAAGMAVPAARLPAEPGPRPTRLASANPSHPVRIASLSSEADEMLMGLVGPERIACITYLGTVPDYSRIAESAPLVPRHIRHIADVEPIIAMEPDLVVVNTFNRHEVVYLLGQAGLAVHRIEYPKRLETIAQNLLHLGRAVGEEERALDLIEDLEAARREVEARAQGLPPVRVLFLSGHFFGEGTESLPSDLLRVAGGRNVVEGASRQVTPEEIVFLDPDVVVLGEAMRAVFASDPALSGIRARLVTAAWRDVQPPSQFAADALRNWEAILHPRVPGERDAGVARP